MLRYRQLYILKNVVLNSLKLRAPREALATPSGGWDHQVGNQWSEIWFLFGDVSIVLRKMLTYSVVIQFVDKLRLLYQTILVSNII